MKLFLKILNITTIIVVSCYIFLTYQFYSLLILITGNWSPQIYSYSKIPYYLLWIAVIVNIVLNIIVYIKNRNTISSRRIKLPIMSGIFIGCILLISIIFTPKFEFLYYHKEGFTYPESIRYDKLFVCNYFYSNEGDYEGGYGDAKYLYIPGLKKMIYIDTDGIRSYDVKFLKNKKVKIGRLIYNIESDWFDES